MRVYEYCIFSNADSVHFTLSYPQIFLYHRVQQVSSFHSVKIQSDSNCILKNMSPRGVVPFHKLNCYSVVRHVFIDLRKCPRKKYYKELLFANHFTCILTQTLPVTRLSGSQTDQNYLQVRWVTVEKLPDFGRILISVF